MTTNQGGRQHRVASITDDICPRPPQSEYLPEVLATTIPDAIHILQTLLNGVCISMDIEGGMSLLNLGCGVLHVVDHVTGEVGHVHLSEGDRARLAKDTSALSMWKLSEGREIEPSATGIGRVA